MKFLKRLFALLFVACCANASAQTIHYNIDTTFHRIAECKDGNAVFFEVKSKYPERSDHLARRADSALQGASLTMNGYIIFQLVIDCNGKAAKITLQQTDAKYQPIQFPKEVVERLYGFVTGLKEWKKATLEGQPVYYRTYLSFKIRNGHVAAVSP